MSGYDGRNNRASDPTLDIARGNYPSITSVNKFGKNANCDNGTATDIWDLVSQPIWLAPTAARIHAIVSSSDVDSADGGENEAGNGAQTIRVYGLKTWDSAETSEVVTLDGTTAVNTQNSYVIIHRMKILTTGGDAAATGIIKATAASDATITAEIVIGANQTLMAVYGVPRGKTAYVTNYYFHMLKASLAATNAVADCSVLVNEAPDVNPVLFLTKHTGSLSLLGTTGFQHHWNPYNGFAGPCIIKSQVTTGTDDLEISSGFDIILADD